MSVRPEGDEVVIYSGMLVISARSIRVCRLDEGENSLIFSSIMMGDGDEQRGGFNSSMYYRG